ncbi:MAG: T9SS type A sorting domain-containing protein [Flavobacteriales bacterium]|nr:T9SS type A sorting domain-containing protein [Flavobacteriales bacterium]
MKKCFLFASILSLISFTIIAQDNPATAPLVVQQNWLAGASFTAGTLGATTSGYAVCSGTSEDDDTWYRFVATTQGAKITIQNPVFDAMIQLFDNSYNPLACENSQAGNVTEVMKLNTLIVGATYYVRVHSLNGAGGAGTFQRAFQYYPTSQVNNAWSPYPQSDDTFPGYKIAQTTRRIAFTAAENLLIQSTRWKFIDTSNGDVFTQVVTGSTTLVTLDDVGGLCFGKTYDTYAEIQVDNFYCGYNVVKTIMTEAEPNTTMIAGYNGGFYPIDGQVKATFVGDGQDLEWELTTDQGQTVLYYIGAYNSSWLFLQEIPCIRFNKIYSIRIRASLCNSPMGPWSPYYYIIILPLPYTNVDPEYCNETLADGVTITCDFIDVANQYGWQFAPIELGDPTMTPIGPSLVTYTTWTSLYLGPLYLDLDVTYRVGVKPFLGTFIPDGCNDPQEGDYGQFCPITIVDFVQFAPDDDQQMPELNDAKGDTDFSDERSFSVFTVSPSEKVLTLKVAKEYTGENGRVKIFDLSGNVVWEYAILHLNQADIVQLPFPADLATGIYIISLSTESSNVSEKIFVR